MDNNNIICERADMENFKVNSNTNLPIDLTYDDNGSNNPGRIFDAYDNDFVDVDVVVDNTTSSTTTTRPPTSAITITIPLINEPVNGDSIDENSVSKENEDCVVVEELTSVNTQLDPNILWITNLPKSTKANELKQLLSLCGKVMCAKVVVNAKYPGSCCFGYVVMDSTDDANRVIEKLNDTEFNGQIIKIDKFGNRSDQTSQDKNEVDANKTIVENQNNNENPKSVPDRRRASSVDPSQHRRRSRSIERRRPHHSSTTTRNSHRSGVLTFDKIKEERERQRVRDRERALREDSRRRHEETVRIREISRRQRDEAERLEREREKLRLERDQIERKKSELLKLEHEREIFEKLEMDRLTLQHTQLFDNRTFKRDNENNPNNLRFDRPRYNNLSQRKYPTPFRYYNKRSNSNRIESGIDRRRLLDSAYRGAAYRNIRSEGIRRDVRYNERERSPRYPSNGYERYGRNNNSIWDRNEQNDIPGPSSFRY